MSTHPDEFVSGVQVRSSEYGIGHVLVDQGESVVVQFENNILSVHHSDISSVPSSSEIISSPAWHKPIEVITRIQAETIQSINDTWGVFSQSRIALLPHQLWVCRKVNETWPTRWLVADDVGLGKTIEAGLILLPLLSRARVKRLLILCPASLVDQWHERLLEMFDIRVNKYISELDTERSDYWNGHDQVIASLQTLRSERGNRQDRLIEAEPWDMVMVDEAHHLNIEERTGGTLGYRLINKLINANKVESIVFFTGTPHRGKDFGFWGLMQLLRPDLFGADQTSASQFLNLKDAMIRNNKQNVTDLAGNRLFKKPQVHSETYEYSFEEAFFYDKLSDFISSGKAYASKLGVSDQRLAMLVLITMQKLASSSVAAVSRALSRRLDRIVDVRREKEALESQRRSLETSFYEYSEAQETGDFDEIGQLDERIMELSSTLALMENEGPRLHELLDSAQQVQDETKIKEIISTIEGKFRNQSVLLFTEYKATQSMMMSKLIERFGNGSVTFINGDGQAHGVIGSDGNSRTITEDRKSAALRFNSGNVRYLVSTEAAGEGIDLQENCFNLIHIDLPWNPMRLHQRVGRLNRYGQTEQVNVVQFHNPKTVESRIWDLLNDKMARIVGTLNHAMDEPEDLMELVLGMTSQSMFHQLFSEANDIGRDRLDDWFDDKTSTFGGRDSVDAVNELVGNAAKFDFQQMSSRLPSLDLPDLSPFLRAILVLNHRRVNIDERGMSFLTPDAWNGSPGVRISYEGLVFDRSDSTIDGAHRVLGVGHRVIDSAISQAKTSESIVTVLPKTMISNPIVAFRIVDQVTTDRGVIRAVIAGVEMSPTDLNRPKLLRDEELLLKCNELTKVPGNRLMSEPNRPTDANEVDSVISEAQVFLESNLDGLDLPFRVPAVTFLAIIWPEGDPIAPKDDRQVR